MDLHCFQNMYTLYVSVLSIVTDLQIRVQVFWPVLMVDIHLLGHVPNGKLRVCFFFTNFKDKLLDSRDKKALFCDL